jgi:hypothetical protein
MPYAGHTLRPREAADYIARKWQSTDERHKGLATMMAESRGNVGAWNDNLNKDGSLASRDCGLFQINVNAYDLPGLEPDLRTESHDPLVWDSVVRTNVGYAKNMWDRRKWQPWVAYNTGWATFSEAWVWRHVDGEPTGPWVATGRYIHKAIVGWANWNLMIALTKNPTGALASAHRQQTKWKVKGELGLRAGKVAFISLPPKPEEPPTDGVGPRPVSNDGK